MARVADAVLKFAVTRENHQALGVIVEPTSGVNPGQVNEVAQGYAAVMVRKLAHDLKGFVKEN